MRDVGSWEYVSERLKAVKPSVWYDVSCDGTIYDLYIDNSFEGRVQKHLARDETPWSRRFSVDGDSHGFSDDLASAQALLLREIHDGAGRTVPVFDSLEEKRQRILALEAVVAVARRIYATDLYALENLKELGVEVTTENSALTQELGLALASLDLCK